MKMFKCPLCGLVCDAAHSNIDGTVLFCMGCGHRLDRNKDVIEEAESR